MEIQWRGTNSQLAWHGTPNPIAVTFDYRSPLFQAICIFPFHSNGDEHHWRIDRCVAEVGQTRARKEETRPLRERKCVRAIRGSDRKIELNDRLKSGPFYARRIRLPGTWALWAPRYDRRYRLTDNNSTCGRFHTALLSERSRITVRKSGF